MIRRRSLSTSPCKHGLLRKRIVRYSMNCWLCIGTDIGGRHARGPISQPLRGHVCHEHALHLEGLLQDCVQLRRSNRTSIVGSMRSDKILLVRQLLAQLPGRSVELCDVWHVRDG